MEIEEAAAQFDVPGRLVSTSAVGRGNVNDTYEAVFRSGASLTRVIVQRINRRVFERPEWIMENMRVVTDHVLRKVLREAGEAGREWGFPQVVPSREGGDYYIDEANGFWRAITMIDAASSYEKVQNAEHAYEAGAVLGCFHRLVSDIDPAQLHDTLPEFHLCPDYLRRYDETPPQARGRGMADPDEVARLREFVEARRGGVSVLADALAEGRLSMRPTHGDPKVDNIMIDDFTGKGIGIVDLDTVKPGLIHYDFGDALRSVCNPMGEDAANLEEVRFNLGLCEAFTKGYSAHAGEFLDADDRSLLYESIWLIAFELGLRFFRDYLAGDVYFKVRYAEQNLHRARVQFRLCVSIEANERAIRELLAPLFA